ncbi:MAG TPA: hydantoinase B/oxoprolinase family protein [Phycisphaerales bacterium]|nr:hydantoinase B/oxoprolinase family protein [Phycisphaerales bacterium]
MADPSPTMPRPWRVCVDTGGTFTDCIALSPTGEVRRAKVLSSSCLRAAVLESRGPLMRITGRGLAALPSFAGFTLRVHDQGEALITKSHLLDDSTLELTLGLEVIVNPGSLCELSSGEPAPLLAARLATSTPLNHPFPPLELRLATTRGTNALLERRAGPAALFLTAGFADLLTIGTQQRPDLFALAPRKPRGIDCDTIEVSGRLDAHGRELQPLDIESLRVHAHALVSRGITCAAVALMHAWRNPAHEQLAAQVLRDAGFRHISLSSEIAGRIGYLDRARTTLVNAYLAPVVDSFVAEVAHGLGAPNSNPTATTTSPAPNTPRLLLMTSAGGLVTPDAFHPKDSLLSGPAGGVVGALDAARRSGFTRVLAFDMGGTSTDVARIDNELDYVFEHRVGPGTVMAPAVAVESVAAGGGSVCWFDAASTLFRVGPQSAGASPGPACYGAGGPLTMTDVNLLLGRLDPSRVPLPLDCAASQRAAAALLAQVTAAGRDLSEQQMLDALLAVANEQMAAAMRTVSVRQGYDPRDYAILAFGGAGGQHACGVAALLGVDTVIVSQDVGLLSARGLAAAGIERFATRQVLASLTTAPLADILAELSAHAAAQLENDGYSKATITRRIIAARLAGQENTIAVEVDDTTDLEHQVRTGFARLFRQTYGYAPVARVLEVESIRVVARAMEEPFDIPTAPIYAPHSTSTTPSTWPSHPRESLRPGDSIHGPAIISEAHATTIVEHGWTATVDAAHALILRRDDPAPSAHAPAHAAEHDILAARLTAIATDMGEMLRRTALSTNVKDRLDFSCAVLDPDGELVVNAPHIPVHLGALGLCVRLVKHTLPMHPGDVVVTNHPAFGGSHLPDVTVIAPVYHDGTLIAFVATRAHHAEIGGIRPGSMPPGARTLAEEGVVIPPMHLIHHGEPRLDEFRRVLLEAPHPTRAVEENLADVRAQLAACTRGQHCLLALAAEFGPALPRVMHTLRSRSESIVRAALERVVTRELAATEYLDDGSVINVTIRRDADKTIIDFTGSSPTHALNLNAPLGVIRSAVMYVLRLLVDEPLPLNEGLLRAVDLRVPEGMLNPLFDKDPARCPAVSAGNVETSQRVVDTLLKALNLAACSQGTMNNVVFGNDRFGYYETVCGGAGATATTHGESAVHTHMTNTRITDPEFLEHRYPVRLERFEIRRGSGGAGLFHGGDGVNREYTFLEPVSLSLLTQHRNERPYGLEGGTGGRRGHQVIFWPDGQSHQVPHFCSYDLPAGSRLFLETPGGGGWGTPA